MNQNVLNENTTIHLTLESLDDNLLKIHKTIENKELKLRKMKLVIALTQLFAKENIDAFFDINTHHVTEGKSFTKSKTINRRRNKK